jgi:Trypsin
MHAWPLFAIAPIVGGYDAQPGAWPDMVAVIANGKVTCGGVLVAPDVVVTAAHCCGQVGSTQDPPPDHVLIGATRLSEPQLGETIAVAQVIPHPDHVTQLDVGVLVLAQPSTRTPRAIATGWAAAEIHDNAPAIIVGWGATSPTSATLSDPLEQADVPIVDALCTDTTLGCRPALEPGGELRAGGGGHDTCGGDSGGPLYVTAPFGTFLGATTYAGYVTAGSTCGDGGIYERADNFITWVEGASGRTLPRVAGPSAPPIEVAAGDSATTTIVVGDPAIGAAHSFELGPPPARGDAAVDAAGVVTYRARDPGTDTIAVVVRDSATPARAAALTIDVTVGPGGCGCRSASAGGAVPTLIVLAAMRRRQRPRYSARI